MLNQSLLITSILVSPAISRKGIRNVVLFIRLFLLYDVVPCFLVLWQLARCVQELVVEVPSVLSSILDSRPLENFLFAA